MLLFMYRTRLKSLQQMIFFCICYVNQVLLTERFCTQDWQMSNLYPCAQMLVLLVVQCKNRVQADTALAKTLVIKVRLLGDQQRLQEVSDPTQEIVPTHNPIKQNLLLFFYTVFVQIQAICFPIFSLNTKLSVVSIL